MSRPTPQEVVPAGAGAPLADLRVEARRVTAAAAEQGISLRVLGGVAVALLCPSTAAPPLARDYKDLDVVGLSSQGEGIDRLLRSLGYRAEEEFNQLHGSQRLLFWDTTNDRQVDVFLDRFSMCHSLDLHDRLDVAETTLAPADLLLMKLQVVETNERDLIDMVALLHDRELDLDRLLEVLAGDWGWWRTAGEVLTKVERYAAGLADFDGAARVDERVHELRAAVEAAPKGTRWRMRARVGDRIRWYELPEDQEE